MILHTEPGIIMPRFILKGNTHMVDLKNLGLKCKEFRVSLGVLQSDVANDTGYSLENISAFETGRNDNARILLWYFMHGMTVDHIQ